MTFIFPVKNNIPIFFKSSQSCVTNSYAIDKTPQTDVFEKSNEKTNIDYYTKSKTMEKLYSPEFYIKPKKNKDGFYRTTVINNETGKPKKIYVKKIDNYYRRNTEECWCFFEKNLFSNYKLIGQRSFAINPVSHEIEPGYMENESKGKYSGLGLRGHQIAVERLMQKDLKKINIIALPEAIPFHYKSGFQFQSKKNKYTPEEYKYRLNILSKDIGISSEEIEPYIVKKQENNNTITVDTGKSKGNIQLLKLQKKLPIYEDSKMVLEGENLDKWKERALSQPIILGVD